MISEILISQYTYFSYAFIFEIINSLVVKKKNLFLPKEWEGGHITDVCASSIKFNKPNLDFF